MDEEATADRDPAVGDSTQPRDRSEGNVVRTGVSWTADVTTVRVTPCPPRELRRGNGPGGLDDTGDDTSSVPLHDDQQREGLTDRRRHDRLLEGERRMPMCHTDRLFCLCRLAHSAAAVRDGDLETRVLLLEPQRDPPLSEHWGNVSESLRLHGGTITALRRDVSGASVAGGEAPPVQLRLRHERSGDSGAPSRGEGLRHRKKRSRNFDGCSTDSNVKAQRNPSTAMQAR